MSIDRRECLKLAGVGVTALAGFGTSSVGAAAGSPPNSDDWQLSFEDQFEGGSLDTSNWAVGFGWGMTSRNDDADVAHDNVHVEDGRLRLEVEHGGSGIVTQGAIHSKGLNTISPPVYVESRIRPAGRAGVLPAFWSKPNSEAWPPEIDFLEVFNYDGDTDEHQAHFNIHYSTSGICGDGGSHTAVGSMDHDPGHKVTEAFHVYGCLWLDDRVEFYFDGSRVASVTDPSVMASLNSSGCLPHYLMFTNHVNRVGTPDYSSSWREETLVDWVRIWDYAPDSGSTDPGNLLTIHGDRGKANYEFTVSGDLEKSVDGDATVDDHDAVEGSTASGHVWGGRDSYRFSGDVTDFWIDGPATVAIDGETVDPASLMSDLEHTLTIHGDRGKANYEVTVSGDLEKTVDGDATVDDHDAVEGSTASGHVWGGRDSYRFSGEITSFDVDGPATVYLDGEAVDLSD